MNRIPIQYEDTLRTARDAQIAIVDAHPRSGNLLFVALHEIDAPCFCALALTRAATLELARQLLQTIGATR